MNIKKFLIYFALFTFVALITIGAIVFVDSLNAPSERTIPPKTPPKLINDVDCTGGVCQVSVFVYNQNILYKCYLNESQTICNIPIYNSKEILKRNGVFIER